MVKAIATRVGPPRPFLFGERDFSRDLSRGFKLSVPRLDGLIQITACTGVYVPFQWTPDPAERQARTGAEWFAMLSSFHGSSWKSVIAVRPKV